MSSSQSRLLKATSVSPWAMLRDPELNTAPASSIRVARGTTDAGPGPRSAALIAPTSWPGTNGLGRIWSAPASYDPRASSWGSSRRTSGQVQVSWIWAITCSRSGSSGGTPQITMSNSVSPRRRNPAGGAATLTVSTSASPAQHPITARYSGLPSMISARAGPTRGMSRPPNLRPREA